MKNQGIQDTQNRRHELTCILSGLLQEYKIIGETDWGKALSDVRFSDLEDSYQYQTAVNAGCNVLLTLNIRDFKQITDSPISIMTPEEFVNKYIH